MRGAKAASRGRSIFERMDVDLDGLIQQSRHVRRVRAEPYSYETGGSRRVRMSEPPRVVSGGQWKHDRFEGSSNDPTSTVFVRGLSKDVSEARLRHLFDSNGCEVCFIRVERAPLTTAIVGFNRRDAAKRAVERLHGRSFMGEPVKVMAYARETASRQAQELQKAKERQEAEQMRLELQAMAAGTSPERRMQIKAQMEEAAADDLVTNRRKITMASMAPKQSVFDRVS